jgi:hypothetical protein
MRILIVSGGAAAAGEGVGRILSTSLRDSTAGAALVLAAAGAVFLGGAKALGLGGPRALLGR